jgi:hypothetical protein
MTLLFCQVRAEAVFDNTAYKELTFLFIACEQSLPRILERAYTARGWRRKW